jgi:hypothetical protein
MAGAVEGVLEVADGGVDPGQIGLLDTGRPAAGDDRLVLDVGGGDAAKAAQEAIGDDDAVGVDVLGRPGRQLMLARAPSTTFLRSRSGWPS